MRSALDSLKLNGPLMLPIAIRTSAGSNFGVACNNERIIPHPSRHTRLAIADRHDGRIDAIWYDCSSVWLHCGSNGLFESVSR